MKIEYSIPHRGVENEPYPDKVPGFFNMSIESVPDYKLSEFAEHAAEDYFWNHDGWEDKSWPIALIIHLIDDKGNKSDYKFSVEMESYPLFTAGKVN